MLISVAMICSCQKQDLDTEQQFARRKTELDARENALVEREKEVALKETALKERENALAKSRKAATNLGTIPPDAQPQATIRDAAEAKAERDKIIQQFSAEIRAQLPDPEQLKAARAEKDRLTQERLAERQRRREESQGQEQYKLQQPQKGWMSGAAVSPALEAPSPTPSATP